jgi:hypothetical protein
VLYLGYCVCIAHESFDLFLARVGGDFRAIVDVQRRLARAAEIALHFHLYLMYNYSSFGSFAVDIVAIAGRESEE